MKGLYVHIPFCIKKCKYCDFVSFTCGDKSAYIEELCKELSKYNGEKIDTVFIGGGTPTILSEALLEKLILCIKTTFKLDKNTEWSIEANPKTVDERKLKLLAKHGINRISIGVQSFNDNELAAIGRAHNAKEAIETVELAKKYFDNINIDLIFALPNQTFESFLNTLNTAISLNTSHISCYSLILEEGTPLYNEHLNSPLILPDEDTERNMYEEAFSLLNKSGYNRYEISNFAKENRECRHNLKYWQCDDYIGAGLAAHSLLDGARYENTADMSEYLKGNYIKEKTVLDDKDRIAEYIIMSFRLQKGILNKDFSKKFEKDFETNYKKQLDRFIKLGLIERTDTGFRLTNEGISLSNSVLCEFI